MSQEVFSGSQSTETQNSAWEKRIESYGENISIIKETNTRERVDTFRKFLDEARRHHI